MGDHAKPGKAVHKPKRELMAKHRRQALLVRLGFWGRKAHKVAKPYLIVTYIYASVAIMGLLLLALKQHAICV